MDMYISEVHNEAIEEYINNILKEKHLNMPNVDDYTEHRIKQLAKDIFYAGYKDALDTEELEKENCCGGIRIKLDQNYIEKIKECIQELKDVKNTYNIDKLELQSDTTSDEIIKAFEALSKKTRLSSM